MCPISCIFSRNSLQQCNCPKSECDHLNGGNMVTYAKYSNPWCSSVFNCLMLLLLFLVSDKWKYACSYWILKQLVNDSAFHNNYGLALDLSQTLGLRLWTAIVQTAVQSEHYNVSNVQPLFTTFPLKMILTISVKTFRGCARKSPMDYRWRTRQFRMLRSRRNTFLHLHRCWNRKW